MNVNTGMDPSVIPALRHLQAERPSLVHESLYLLCWSPTTGLEENHLKFLDTPLLYCYRTVIFS